MNPTDKRNHKIKCDFGLPDYVKFYRKTSKNPKSAEVASSVIKDYFRANKDLISSNFYTFKFPEQMGRIEVRKSKKRVFIDENDKVVNRLSINWKETNKLWEENAKAKEKKIIIRYTNEHTGGYVFFPIYLKNRATFKKKSLYKMRLNREMARNMYDSIMNKKLDAFLLFKEV